MLKMRALIAAGLIGLGFSVPAPAQTLFLGSQGPIVLPTSPSSGRPIPDVPNAVPVPSVMNGGGFGLTGTDYFADGLSEGPLNQRHRPREYVLAPARIGPPDYVRPALR
ncbi:hypothetical protein MTL_11550 [Methylobacterium goesingense]|nr:hypothetical protein [Methylobacterium goesingense]